MEAASSHCSDFQTFIFFIKSLFTIVVMKKCVLNSLIILIKIQL